MAERKMSRKWLEAMGIDADKIDAICEAHSDLMQSIKDERDRIQGELDKANDTLKGIDTSKDWKQMYNDLVDANAKKEARTAKEAALRAVYTEAGISEKYIGSLLRIADYDKIELDKDGKAKNHAQLVESAKADNADFIPKVTKQTAGAANPPANGAGTNTKLNRADILKIADTTERQNAWKQYLAQQNQQKGT